MKKEKFQQFWDEWSQMWHTQATVSANGQSVKVSELCELRKDYSSELYKRYGIIKKVIKDNYFAHREDKDIRLNKYKRAAVIAYTINGAVPLIYKDTGEESLRIDPYFLKQRLTFYVAWGSILQEYPQEKLGRCPFRLFAPELSPEEAEAGADSFLTSVYKDMFYAEIYRNYNVLTMANLFWLLTEKASSLSQIVPFSSVEHGKN